MNIEIVPLLKCPACGYGKLSYHVFSEIGKGVVRDGVVLCTKCNKWYPIDDGLLELLTGDLVYRDDRQKFIVTHSDELEQLGLDVNFSPPELCDHTLQFQQQSHFDWYAHNSKQSYSDYENTPFWLAADKIAFEPWREQIRSGKFLLDVGCAQGRSTFKLMDLDIQILGMDVSKHLVRQAIERYRKGIFRARATFIAADANGLPLNDDVIDYLLIYGVLHHLPDPTRTCQEIERVLKPGGIYFGSENNVTVFRKLFDMLQKIIPIWSEEAGPEALISRKYLLDAFQGIDIQLQTSTSVFLPPHLMNLFSPTLAYRFLKFFDNLGQAIPSLKGNGGLILIRGEKLKG